MNNRYNDSCFSDYPDQNLLPVAASHQKWLAFQSDVFILGTRCHSRRSPVDAANHRSTRARR